MFRIVSEPTFTHDVTAMTPVDGGHEAETFKTTFRVLPVDEVAKLNLMSQEGSRQLLVRAIVRIDELVDAQKKPITYSDAVRDQVIALPHVRLALSTAYFEAVSKAKAKN